jgi:hypothetical protein
MPKANEERLDTSNLRYWNQNARRAVRDVYDALVEIITNADDRYMLLGSKKGRIVIEVERRRKGTPGIVRVRDFADGMTTDDMHGKLRRVGDRVSGMERGQAVRGTNSRGAKDVAILGGVVFESVAGDGQYHCCEITPQGRFHCQGPMAMGLDSHRSRLGIPKGTGTVVSITVDPNVARIPQHDTLRQDLAQLVVLRDILASREREVVLYDVNQGRHDVIQAVVIEGNERVSQRFRVPGYGDVEAKIIVKRAKKRLEDQRPKFRAGGILVKSRHAIHEATLFAPDLENDPDAKWFYGRLTCEHIDTLWNEYDERFEQGLPFTQANPCPIVDPLRKEGLAREHPFVQALFRESLKHLRPLVEEERRRAERQQAKIESDETRRRLRALEKAAAKFMGENNEDQEAPRNADDTVPDSAFERNGFSLNPPYAQIVLGHSVRFWLNVKQQAFPELSVGDTVEISCATQEISSSARFLSLEAHPSREGVLRCIWTVKGEKVTKATAVKARVGAIASESVVEVLGTEADKYADIVGFQFSRKTYSVQVGSRKVIALYAPFPGVVSAATPVNISCSDPGFRIGGSKDLVPHPDLGVAVCRLGLSASQPGLRGELTASIPGHKCQAEVMSLEPMGAKLEIKVEDRSFENQRYIWRGNVIEIGARHPALRRYLGEAPDFPGQEEKHFRVILAEIVSEAVCSRILGQRSLSRAEDYTDVDWEAYYAEYTELLTKFLPIAHETQVRI